MKLKQKIAEWLVPPRFEGEEQVTAGIGKDGLEYGDPVPFAPPIGLKQPETQADMILRMIHGARLAEAAQAADFDTEDEANDFEIEDDPIDPTTPWEEPFLPPKRPPAAAAKPADAVSPSSTTAATPASVATPTEAPKGAQTPASSGK